MPRAEGRRRVAEDQTPDCIDTNLQFEWLDIKLENPGVYLRAIATPTTTPDVAVSK